MIKLNGKSYLNKDEIFYIIEKYIISIEMAQYHEVSSEIGEISTSVADAVALQMAHIQDTFGVHFEKEPYLKATLASEYVLRKKYTEKTSSSESTKVASPTTESLVIRFVFNICMDVLAEEFAKLGDGA